MKNSLAVLSYREVGKILGLSGQRVEQIERRALLKCRELLEMGRGQKLCAHPASERHGPSGLKD